MARSVRIFKGSNNGTFTLVVNSLSAEEFLDDLVEALDETLYVLEGDQLFTLQGVIPLVCRAWTAVADGRLAEKAGDPLGRALTLVLGESDELLNHELRCVSECLPVPAQP